MTSRLLALTAVLALALAACGEEEPAGAPGATGTGAATATDAATATEPGTATGGATATETAPGTPAEAAGEVTVATAGSDLGEVLVDGEGATLYLFDNDGGGPDSTCYDDCATNWPPLTVEGEPSAGDGADDSLLGTTERDDGTLQVTYGGHPLYYFAGDSAPGDTAGQGVGDIWWVVDPGGDAVHEAETAGDSGMGSSDY